MSDSRIHQSNKPETFSSTHHYLSIGELPRALGETPAAFIAACSLQSQPLYPADSQRHPCADSAVWFGPLRRFWGHRSRPIYSFDSRRRKWLPSTHWKRCRMGVPAPHFRIDELVTQEKGIRDWIDCRELVAVRCF